MSVTAALPLAQHVAMTALVEVLVDLLLPTEMVVLMSG